MQTLHRLRCFFRISPYRYCTDIGNIGDEGQSKPMSQEAESSVDSLMSKFDLDGGDSKGGGDRDKEGKLLGEGEKRNRDTKSAPIGEFRRNGV